MGSLTWNGVPLLLPDKHGQLQQWLRQFHDIHDIIAFCGVESARLNSGNAPQSIAGPGITPPNWPQLPPLQINRLIMPVGATRFGYFVGFLPANAASVGDPGDGGTLSMSDGTHTQNVKLYTLAFRPVTDVPGENQLALLILVDRRFGWFDYDCGNIITENGFPMLETSGSLSGTPNNDYGQYAIGYSEIFLALEQRLEVEFDRSEVGGFLSADVLELTNRKYFNAAMMLDAVAESCGLRVWCGFDDTIHIRNPDTAFWSNFEDETNLIAGGLYPSIPRPAVMQVNFPRATYYRSYADGDRYTLSIPIEGGTEGAITVNSSCYAHWTSEPDNYVNPPENQANLSSLAANITSAASGWLSPSSYDVTFMGVKPWQQSGFDNYVSIDYSVQVPNDAFNIPIDRDSIPKENTRYDLNYYAFTMRVQSMPHDAGAGQPLTRPIGYVLARGTVGQAREIAQPPVKEGDTLYPQPALIDIWQVTSTFSERNTGIQIQAFNANDQTATLPLGTRVVLFFHEVNRRWMYQTFSEKTASVVQVDSTSTADMIRKNATCLWPGKIVNANVDNTPCGNGFWVTPNDRVWLVTVNNDGSVIDYLLNKERYVGVLIGTYSYNDEPALPLYAIKEAHHLIRFQLIKSLDVNDGGGTFNAIELQWSAATNDYQPIGNPITVVDYFDDTGGQFSGLGTNGIEPGYRGWAEWKPDRQVYEIVWMEHQAIFVWFQLKAGQSLGPDSVSAMASVLSYWQGRNPDPQNVGVKLQNIFDRDLNGVFCVPPLASGLAMWNDQLKVYFVLFVQSRPTFITGKLTRNIVDGAAGGTVAYAWGSPTGVRNIPAAVELLDKTDPKIFTGSTNDQFQATWDPKSEKYILTWVAWPERDGGLTMACEGIQVQPGCCCSVAFETSRILGIVGTSALPEYGCVGIASIEDVLLPGNIGQLPKYKMLILGSIGNCGVRQYDYTVSQNLAIRDWVEAGGRVVAGTSTITCFDPTWSPFMPGSTPNVDRFNNFMGFLGASIQMSIPAVFAPPFGACNNSCDFPGVPQAVPIVDGITAMPHGVCGQLTGGTSICKITHENASCNGEISFLNGEKIGDGVVFACAANDFFLLTCASVGATINPNCTFFRRVCNWPVSAMLPP